MEVHLRAVASVAEIVGDGEALHHPHPPRPTLRAAAALAGAGQDGAAGDFGGVDGEVSIGKGLGAEGPDGAEVAATVGVGVDHRRCAVPLPVRRSAGTLAAFVAGAHSLLTACGPAEHVALGAVARHRVVFPHRLRVVEVRRLLRQQEHLLVRARRPVAHALRHARLLRPDHFGAQVPPVGLERQRHPPGDADEVLGLEALGTQSVAGGHQRRRLLASLQRRAVVAPVGGVGVVRIPQVQPYGAIVS
jgi:hypothetical protein